MYRLLAPVVETVGAEIFDIQWAGGTLRVVAQRDGGITTEQLAEINRLVSPILDQHDPVPGRYTLEVSSPGVERKLRRSAHYRQAIGETIIVKQIPGVEPRRLKGLLESFDEDTITMVVIEADGVDLAEPDTRSVEIVDIDSAKPILFGVRPRRRVAAASGRRKPRAPPRAAKTNKPVTRARNYNKREARKADE